MWPYNATRGYTLSNITHGLPHTSIAEPRPLITSFVPDTMPAETKTPRAWETCPRPQLTPPSQRTAADKKAAQDADAKSHATLRRLQKESGGCADCTARISGWAALPHGAFVCINCAQIHRRIGRHISQVKAINTGTYLWYADEVALMAWGGNARVQSEFCADPQAPPRPDEGSPVEVKERYIRDKYVLGPCPCSQPLPPRGNDNDACCSAHRFILVLLMHLLEVRLKCVRDAHVCSNESASFVT